MRLELRSELKIRKRNECREKIGAIAIIEKESEIKCLDLEIGEMITYISEVEATIQAK